MRLTLAGAMSVLLMASFSNHSHARGGKSVSLSIYHNQYIPYVPESFPKFKTYQQREAEYKTRDMLNNPNLTQGKIRP